jgi:hypothetical protein
MEKFTKVIGAAVLIFGGVGLIALISGSILYFIWPVAIPAAFPELVKNGTLASNLSWWQSVCLTWVFGILFKGNSEQKDKQ